MEMNIGYLLKNVSDKMRVMGDADLKKYHLTFSQSTVLAFLKSQDGYQSTQKEIERFMRVSHPTVVGILARMEKSGFVTTALDPHDRRHKIVTLTQQAVDVSEVLEQSMHANERRMTKSLNEEEIAELKRYLMVMYKNLEDL